MRKECRKREPIMTVIDSAAPIPAPALLDPYQPRPAPEAQSDPLWKVWSILRLSAESMFGFDYRSMALMRICMAALMMWVT